MTLDKIQEQYPINQTFIGYYECLDTFENSSDVLSDLPEPDDYYEHITFFRDIDNSTTEYWVFYYAPVLGYLTLDGKDFRLMTYNEDMGWEEYNPTIEDDSRAIIVGELTPKRVMETLDPESYDADSMWVLKK